MRCDEIRRRVCRDGSRFSMPMHELKARLGPPDDIRILARWCAETGSDVALLRYRADDGAVELFCPIQLIQGEEHAISGWLTIARHSEDGSGRETPGRSSGAGRKAAGLPPVQQRLFG